MYFKKWIVNLLSFILGGWLVFCSLTIDNIGNKSYNIVLIIWTILALLSFYLLRKYSKILD